MCPLPDTRKMMGAWPIDSIERCHLGQQQAAIAPVPIFFGAGVFFRDFAQVSWNSSGGIPKRSCAGVWNMVGRSDS
jgi:hypothetical protein